MNNTNGNDPVKSLFTEMAADNLKKISGMIKSIPAADRLNFLRSSDPSSSILLKVYHSAKELEDYEVCASVKSLLLERGVELE